MLTLVVLAAGAGSRYGKLKQVEPLGPAGETLIDYTIHDARRAGFRAVVLIIRPEMEATFGRLARARYAPLVDVALAPQRLDDLPDGFRAPPSRTKPWGTAHALLAAEPLVHGPFAVVNADDFYGAESLAAAAEFLARPPSEAARPEFAIVAYRLRDTLSPAGPVNRAVCRTTDGVWLRALEEVRDITRRGDGVTRGVAGGATVELDGDTPISMNLWAFTPAVFPLLHRALRDFLAGDPAPDAECLLPDAMAAALARDEVRVCVLPAGRGWFGITHPADRDIVQAALRRLGESGRYPVPLIP